MIMLQAGRRHGAGDDRTGGPEEVQQAYDRAAKRTRMVRPELRGGGTRCTATLEDEPARVANVLALCQILCTSMSTPKSQTDSPFRRLVRSLSRSSPRSERPPRPQGPDSPPAVPTSNKRYDDIARYAPGAGSPRRESPPASAALSTSPPPGEPSASEPSWRWGGGGGGGKKNMARSRRYRRG